MTKNLEKYYMNRPLADLDALKAKPVSGLVDGLFVNVISMTPYGGRFIWDSTSSATADDINVILPTGQAGNGRWLRDTFTGMSVDSSGNMQLHSGKAYTIANANPARKIEINSAESVLNSLNLRDALYVATAGSFYASFRNSIDAGYSIGGNITATAEGGAAIDNGWLDLSHNDNRYIYYQPTGFTPLQYIGTVRFKIIFSYSGAPEDYKPIVSVAKQLGSTDNLLEITHRPTGVIGFQALNSSGGTVVTTGDFGVFSPTMGVEYEFALVVDFTNGATRLFINGVQNGTTVTTISTSRSADIGIIAIGTMASFQLYNSHFLIKDFIIYPTALFTENYTPGYGLPESPITMIGNSSSILQNLFVDGNLAISKNLDVVAHAGGGQTNATPVYGEVNIISTCATADDSIKMMPMYGNLSHKKTIKNKGVAACNVYPVVGGHIDGGTINAPYSLAAGATKSFFQTTPTDWESI